MNSKFLSILFTVVFLNLLFLNFIVLKPFLPPTTPPPAGNQSILPTLTAKISSLESRVSRLASPSSALMLPTPTLFTSPLKTSKTRHLNYLPISGSFSKLSYDWVDIPTSQFYFNPSDYPGLKQVRFEANFKLLNGNGQAFVRLYDSTHNAPLPGSQLQTSSQQDTTVTSSGVNFLPGQNLIKVQIKSLTADTTVFNSAKLIIISEY